jgi:hypothetical protein
MSRDEAFGVNGGRELAEAAQLLQSGLVHNQHSSSAFPVSSATVALAFFFLALVVLNKTTRNLLRSRKSTLPEDDILF